MQTKLLRFFLMIIVFLGIWEFTYLLGAYSLHIWKPYMFPSPQGVFEVLVFELKNKVLLLAFLHSMKRILIGFFFSMLLGCILGLLMANFPTLSNFLRPIALGIQSLPSICWVPFAILWFGLSDSSIIFVIIAGAVFSISLAIENGITTVNPLYINAAKTMGVNGFSLYTKVILPASLPTLVNGFKQGWSFAWRALMSAEMMSASIGLGQILISGRDLADVNQIMLIMLVIIFIGIMVEKFVFMGIENHLLRKRGLI